MNQYQKNLLARANWPHRIAPSRNVSALLAEQAQTAREIAQHKDDLTLLRKNIQKLYDLDDQIKTILFGPESETHSIESSNDPDTKNHLNRRQA